MSKYVMFSTVKSLSGFVQLIEKGLVDIDKKTLLIKKNGTFVKLPIEKLDEFKVYVSKFAPTTTVPTTETISAPATSTVVPKHFTPVGIDYGKSPISQMKYGCKIGTTAGIVLANSNGNGFYMHTVAGINNILFREDNVSSKDRDSIIKLLSYANKHFLTIQQYITALDTLKAIYKGTSTLLCKRIIKTLWVNVTL
ncbi:hypothetical protein [Cetobacterium sp.]|uniref:hypothetical protein n=1 Tax=Cetobacterium sp. TaxID=2071632 RepID=UPI003F3B20B9